MADSTPKTYELLNWVLGDDNNIPLRFIEHKSKLNSVVPYLTEQLWLSPKACIYLNKHLNNLFAIPDPIESLILLKKIVKSQRIIKNDLYSKYPSFGPKYLDIIEKAHDYDEGNSRAKMTMMLELGKKFKNLEKYKATKANIKKNSSSEVKQVIQELVDIKKEEITKPAKLNHYIDENITQDLIDREGLILFDISLLKKRNQILFIFIDKNNHKKYKIEDFVAKIYISKKEGIIHNDYIETLSDEYFQLYHITDFKLYNKLKYMLNNSYTRIFNEG